MSKQIITLIIIILIAGGLRLVSLNQYPVGLNADEAAIGYNAYSLLQTGKDEYGESFPLSFKSFGDFKPGLYFYFVMPLVATLGLNEWVVRLPSAFLGIATVILVFLIGRKIFQSNSIGLFSAGIIAFSPWHIHFSRGGWETNAATFFITLGVYCFLLGLKKPRFLFWGLISLLASMYTYQSPRLIVPILVLCLAGLYSKKLLTRYKRITTGKTKIWLISGLVTLILLTVPIGLQFIGGSGGARFAGLSIFSDEGPLSRVDQLRGEHLNPSHIFPELLHNKLTAYGPNFLGHYLDHFTGSFLFINGDPLIRNKVPETGQFYIITSLFLVIGLISLVLAKIPDKKLLFAWILISPIASSITYQTPHALRALNMVVPLSLVMGYGIGVILGRLGRLGGLGRVGVVLITAVFLFEMVHYLESYYVHYPKRYPLAWEYGFSQMIPKLQSYQKDYQKIVITDRYDQPYILVLFYSKYDPNKYQPQAHLTERDKFNFGTIRNIDNLEFRSFTPEEVSKSPGILFIGTSKDVGENAKIIDRVDFPNEEPAFLFVLGG